MKIVAIVQARMSSIRFPKKVMQPIGTIPMIEVLLRRLQKAKTIDEIVLATSKKPSNKILIDHIKNIGFKYFIGSENDVLKRYINAADKYNADVVVRITGDCPLVDPLVVDECVYKFKKFKVDYCSNINPPTFPDGLDVEVIRLSALKKSATESSHISNKEHVTKYIRETNSFSKKNYSNRINLSSLRWTVDDLDDFKIISKIFKYFEPNIFFSWKQVFALYNKSHKLFQANNIKIKKRNNGEKMKTGQKLWQRAKYIIPGGNMLLSKRPEMFLPNNWPTYFTRAKGCKVWDLDKKRYIDMSIMGVGTNILGYGHPEVDQSVLSAVRLGNMSTLNCPEEVYLAEKLVELHEWSDMARFARSGGEANAIAIRIARAASKRDKIAICGYHGWHDWYLSANLKDKKNLDNHLLSKLEPNGVPINLRDTVFPFKYNNFEELETLVKKHDIGIIKMEVERSVPPSSDFLKKVRNLATKHEIILIFDECTSGFREQFGGLHKKYNVEPDMAMFGKAMGNGYAITAIIGKRKIMKAAQSTFISSTFWTERIGPTAALKTLEVMEREKSWEKITKIGKKIKKRWLELAKKYELNISCCGLDALPVFTFKSKNALAYKTLISQEMLLNGYLASNTVYITTAHTKSIVDEYFYILNKTFKLIKECEDGRDVKKILNDEICHSSFKKLR